MRKQRAKAAAGDGNPDDFAKVRDVNRIVSTLEAAIDNVAKTLNQNLSAIGNAFSHTDAHLMVHRRIQNDMMTDDVVMDELHHGLIDWNWYHRQYHATMGFVDFIRGVKAAFPDEVITVTESSDDFEFSGDQTVAVH